MKMQWFEKAMITIVATCYVLMGLGTWSVVEPPTVAKVLGAGMVLLLACQIMAFATFAPQRIFAQVGCSMGFLMIMFWYEAMVLWYVETGDRGPFAEYSRLIPAMSLVPLLLFLVHMCFERRKLPVP